jgi:hypothetical protein
MGPFLVAVTLLVGDRLFRWRIEEPRRKQRKFAEVSTELCFDLILNMVISKHAYGIRNQTLISRICQLNKGM